MELDFEGKSSREILEHLQDCNMYLFHGTQQRLESLAPRQAYKYNPVTGEKTPDGDPAVFASDLFEPAIFKALVTGRVIPVQSGHSGWDYREGKIYYFASPELLEGLKSSELKAYVLVFKKEDFNQHRGLEYIANKEVKPILTVQVTNKDLPEIEEVN